MHRDRQPAVYILASQRHGTLYVGVTSDLIRRTWLHQQDVIDGFSQRHQTHLLVYVEQHVTMESAITREKQLKKWRRAWKVRLIEADNPGWNDLWPSIIGAEPCR
jgi:putative endonuclease